MAVTLADKLAYLGTPGELDTVVETIETHMSWVFLTERRVYKLKKPIQMPYLDHRSLQARGRSCEKELRLGLRTAPTVYLGVIPLVATERGLALDGDGEIVEWLVEMRRLPTTAMLPYALSCGTASTRDAEALGELLSQLYRTASRARWTGAEYVGRMRELVISYSTELAARGAFGPTVAQLQSMLLARIEQHAQLLEQRIVEGRVVDAHGDLRPEHVCLETPPVAIDPLEFNDDLRTLDAASELAFFTMECERIGAGWFGELVAARYAEVTGDRVPQELVTLYRGQHALVRALIAVRHIVDAPPAEHARWWHKADDYLAHART